MYSVPMFNQKSGPTRGPTSDPTRVSTLDINNTKKNTADIFTGASTSLYGYLGVNLVIQADQDSIVNGIVIQISNDNITFSSFFVDTYFKNTTYEKTILLAANFYKLIVTFSSVSTNYDIYAYLNTNAIQNISNNVYLSPKEERYHDSFGKLRVSNPFTLLDLKIPPLNSSGTTNYKKNNLQIVYSIPSGGVATYNNSQAVFTQNGSGTCISQSRQYCIYQPGKSLLILASFKFDLSSGSENYNLRVGYFDKYNGIFLKFNKSTSTVSFVLRSNTLDTVVPIDGTEYPQTLWNIDTLNGLGNTGINLDFSKAQLLVIDLEWLSIGRIRCGFMLFGQIIYCHAINNVNTLDGPYMYTANLPIHYEVENNSTGNAKLTQICATVISEGGYRPSSNIFSVDSTLLTITNSPASEHNFIALTGNENYYHNQITIQSISVFTSSSDTLKYNIRLYLPGSYSDTAATTNINNNSVTKYIANGELNTAGDSILLEQGYLVQKSTVIIPQETLSIITNKTITSNIDNSAIGYLVITLQNASGSSNFSAAVSANIIEP